MSIGKITITKENGNINRPSANLDGVSGILSYNAATTGLTIKEFYSIDEVENVGYTQTSNYKLEWYQAKTFYEQNPNGRLYIAVAPTGASYDFAEITTFHRNTEYVIRNMVVLTGSYAFNVADIADIKAQIDGLEADNVPLLSLIYSPNVLSITDITGATDLRSGTYDCQALSIVFGSDNGNLGKTLETSLGYSVSMAGAMLGALSSVDVATSVACPGVINITSKSSDFVDVKVGGVDIKNLTPTQISNFHDKGYVFLRKFIDYAGTYISGTPNITNKTNDLNSIELVRVVNKAYREVYKTLVPFISRKIKQLNGNITMADKMTITLAVENILDVMVANEEISSRSVLVPDQDVITTGKLIINIKLTPYGIANEIEVSLGITA